MRKQDRAHQNANNPHSKRQAARTARTSSKQPGRNESSEPRLVTSTGEPVTLGTDIGLARIVVADFFKEELSKDYDSAMANLEGFYCAIQHHPGLQTAANALKRMVSLPYVFNHLYFPESTGETTDLLKLWHEDFSGCQFEYAIKRFRKLQPILDSNPALKMFSDAVAAFMEGYQAMLDLVAQTEAL